MRHRSESRSGEEIERRLREFIDAELLGEPFRGEDPLAEGAVDSLGVEQLVEYVLEVWGVELEDDEIVFANFGSLPALTALVESKAGR